MRNYHEMTAFCQGYLEGALACNATLSDWDDWVIWGGYDINFVGQDYAGEATTEKELSVVVYPKDWTGALPDHLYSFVVRTSTAFEDNLPTPMRKAFNQGESK